MACHVVVMVVVVVVAGVVLFMYLFGGLVGMDGIYVYFRIVSKRDATWGL